MIRLLLIVASLILVGGGYAVRFIDQAIHAPPAPKAAAVQLDEPRAPVHSGRSITLSSGRNGHFTAEARIAGRNLAFLVDTGASMVALRESDAARIGIRPMRSEYTATVSTANGKIKGAPAMLDRVELGGVTVYDVAALVLPDEALSENLLGMAFLSKLKRYEVANGRLVLEQ